MNRHQLEDVLGQVVDALRVNRELATPELLDAVGAVLAWVRDPQVLSPLTGRFGPGVERLLAAADKALAVERDLAGDLGQTLVDALGRLRKRPVILAALAALV